MATVKTLEQIVRTYKNNGQHAQQVAEFNLVGTISKADNKPFWAGGDIGDLQVKSARATICQGLDLEAHLDEDGAKAWGYVTKDFSKLYIMNREEYTMFCEKFFEVTRESTKNGGKEKMRFKKESNEMRKWLEGLEQRLLHHKKI